MPIESIVGVGLTKTTISAGMPEQLFEIGVTLIKLLIGMLDELIAVKEKTFPAPLAGRPVNVLLFVH